MNFVVADKLGYIKIVTENVSEISAGTDSKAKLEKNLSECEISDNVDYNIIKIPPYLNILSDEMLINSMTFIPQKNVNSVSSCFVLKNSVFSDVVKNFVVGRQNGLVQDYDVALSLDNPNEIKDSLKGFIIPDSVIFVSSFSNKSEDLCLALSGSGHCTIVRFQEFPLSTSNEVVGFIPPDIYEPLNIGLSKGGRQYRSIGEQAHPEDESIVDKFKKKIKSYPLNVESSSGWHYNSFHFNSNISAACLSENRTEYMAIAGDNNLLKIIDLNTKTCVFKAKNVLPNHLKIEESVYCKAVSFLDRLSNNGSSIAVGNLNGRVYIYDYRLQSRPVLDFQAVDAHRSVHSIEADSIFEGLFRVDNLENEHSNELRYTYSMRYKSQCDSSSSNIGLNHNLLAVADNYSSVYIYDIRRIDSKLSKESLNTTSKINKTTNKKLPGFLISKAENKPVSYDASLKKVLSNSTGALSSLSFLSHSNSISLLGTGNNRFAYIWDLHSKWILRQKIYLKNQLVCGLWLPSTSLSVINESQSCNDGMSDLSFSDEKLDEIQSNSCYDEEESSYDSESGSF